MRSSSRVRRWIDVGRPAGAATAILFLVLAGEAAGEGVVRDSIAPVSSGRGGTNIAHSDNLAIVNDNPAGLASIDGLRFDVALDALHVDINFQKDAVFPNPENDVNSIDKLWMLPAGFLSWRVPDAPRPITVGFGAFLPAGFGAESRLDVNPVFRKQQYLSQAAVLKLLPAVAVDLGAGFSVGAGFGLAYEDARFKAPFNFASFGGLPALVDMDADGFGYTWNVGVQYRPTNRWTIGLAYIAETRIDLEGNLKLDATGVLPIPDATARYKAKMENTWPRSLGIGTSYRFDRLVLSAEALWFDWSSAFDALTFHLSQGTNPVFDMLVGSEPTDRLNLEWHDSYTARVGAEFLLTPDDTLRAGYIYITNPIPERTMTPLIPAILEHSVTVGYGHRFGRVGIDFAYQFSFGSRRSVDTSEVSGDFDGASMKTMAHWFFVGASLSF
jgi:long-chain fatty acid transport protein